MTWADLSALLLDVWHSPALLLVAGLIGLAGGTFVAMLAQDPGDRYSDYEGDQP